MDGTLIHVKRVASAGVSVRYAVRSIPEAWVLTEDTMPESIPHDDVAHYLRLVLMAWAARSPHTVRVARNLAIRWLEEMPQIGIDPDLCLLWPPPPNVERLSSLRLWLPGHEPPPLCIEIVSANHPHKDYATIQDRYAAIGTRELIVFDPLRAGPAALGGPVALQLWRRDDVGLFERVHFGDEPLYSKVLEAWFVADGELLRIKDTPHGATCWLTAEEHERAAKEHERAAKEHERAAKEHERAARLEAERRVAELEARLE
jgi:Uma2 family endonuclease